MALDIDCTYNTFSVITNKYNWMKEIKGKQEKTQKKIWVLIRKLCLRVHFRPKFIECWS